MTPRPGRWAAKPPNDFEPFAVAAVVMSSLYVVFFLFWLLSPWPSSHVRLWIFVYASALQTLALLGLTFRGFRAMRFRRRENLLSDPVPGRAEFAVQIQINRNGSPIGTDRGVLWFEDSLLGFAGKRTSFLLSAADLIHPEGVVLTAIDAPLRPLKLRVAEGKAEVRVMPLVGGASGYSRHLLQFLEDRSPSEKERQWPPLETYEKMQAPEVAE